jgi:hypothetical protein
MAEYQHRVARVVDPNLASRVEDLLQPRQRRGRGMVKFLADVSAEIDVDEYG